MGAISQVFSALVQIEIARQPLITCLNSPVRPSTAQSLRDVMLGGEDLDWPSDSGRLMRDVDSSLPPTYRAAIRQLLDYEGEPLTKRCRYEESARRFTFATMDLPQEAIDHLAFYTLARGLSHFLSERDGGFAIVQMRYWDEAPITVAVIGLGPDEFSRRLDAEADAPAFTQHEAAADLVLAEMYASMKAALEEDARVSVIDQLDDLR